ncbi:hypothetical protein IW262DRAFT_1479468 [Armillaria fumosa]|nr:hypothetical protein IW262DRAFT_1479468 [Armillaria fumosa]
MTGHVLTRESRTAPADSRSPKEYASGTSTTEVLSILGEECGRSTGDQAQSCIEGSGCRGRLRRRAQTNSGRKEGQLYGPIGEENGANTLQLTARDSVSGAQKECGPSNETPSDAMNVRMFYEKEYGKGMSLQADSGSRTSVLAPRKDIACDEKVFERKEGTNTNKTCIFGIEHGFFVCAKTGTKRPHYRTIFLPMWKNSRAQSSCR